MTNRKGGFENMTPELRKEIASWGGKAAHKMKVAHEWTSEEAKKAAAISVANRLKKLEEKKNANPSPN